MARSSSENDDDKPSRHRSPNYPSISLPNAIERVKALMAKDGKAGAPTEAAAKHIGFSGAHGTARAALSALKKFGLTSDQRGRIVPTQLAIDIINFPAENPRSKAAKQTAALSPLIYKQLVDRFADMGNMPSPESLKPELIADMGFNPKAVDAFLNDLFESLNYAGLLDGNRLLLSDEHPTVQSGPADQLRDTSFPATPAASSGVSAAWPAPRPASQTGTPMRELTLPLMDNEVAYMRLPVPLSDENYDYLLQQVSMMRRGLVAKKEPLPSPTSDSDSQASLPFMITHDMRRKLLEAGCSPAEISQMTPQDAWIKISHSEGFAFDAREP
jgi:hypothetical protein